MPTARGTETGHGPVAVPRSRALPVAITVAVTLAGDRSRSLAAGCRQSCSAFAGSLRIFTSDVDCLSSAQSSIFVASG